MNRILWTLAALGLVVLIIAGCSNAPARTGTDNSGGDNTAAPIATGTKTDAPTETVTGSSTNNNAATAHALAIKFAECMRENGVSRFPDPNASGVLTIEGTPLDPGSAAFKQALDVCKDLLPPGFMQQPQVSPGQQEGRLKFAQCIRDNGVKDFPDPAPDAPLIDTNKIPSANQSGGMTILNAAMQKCRAFGAAAGVTEP